MNAFNEDLTMTKEQTRFTKIGASGEKLADDASDWEAVLDNRTGLMWTVKEKKATSQQKAVAVAKKMAAAGHSDWRLPTVEELFNLADRTRYSPAIDTAYFPDCKSDWYWTATPAAYSPADYAWFVDFYDGGAGWVVRAYGGFVRAVRASQ